MNLPDHNNLSGEDIGEYMWWVEIEHDPGYLEFCKQFTEYELSEKWVNDYESGRP